MRPVHFFFSSALILFGLCINNLNVWLQAFETFKATLRCCLIFKISWQRLDKFLPVRSNFKEIRTEPHLKYHYKSGQLECFFFLSRIVLFFSHKSLPNVVFIYYIDFLYFSIFNIFYFYFFGYTIDIIYLIEYVYIILHMMLHILNYGKPT